MAVNESRSEGPPDGFLEKQVGFPDGSRYERLRPLTDLRKDAGEGRILFICRRLDENGHATGEELVMKIKAQWPGPQKVVFDGPSPHTTSELEALQKFTDADLIAVPHLLVWKRGTQGDDGIYPGGYVIYIVITKMPGSNLFDIGYWSMPKADREEIQKAFISKLNEVRALGIAPYDCALRNVLWDIESKQCSIVDFEHYHDKRGPLENETDELQRWGLAQRPPATWVQEWARSH